MLYKNMLTMSLSLQSSTDLGTVREQYMPRKH